jgi:hypothetical protein
VCRVIRKTCTGGVSYRITLLRCRKREAMNLHDIKYHNCPDDDEDGILLVDVETESVPEVDEDGNYLYYCTEGHTFAVDEDGEAYSYRR